MQSHHLQFGFKTGSSTTLCTGRVKIIVSHYIYNDIKVFVCFLDASKRPLILSIMANSFQSCLTRVYTSSYFVISFHLVFYTMDNSAVGFYIVTLRNLVYLIMVLDRVVFSHLFCLQFIWIVVLDDIGVIYLLVHLVMLMMLFCWPPLPLL